MSYAEGAKKAEWAMTSPNPTQDEVRNMFKYICAKYAQTTELVWQDDFGDTVSMVNIFLRDDGQPSALPSIKTVLEPTDTGC